MPCTLPRDIFHYEDLLHSTLQCIIFLCWFQLQNCWDSVLELIIDASLLHVGSIHYFFKQVDWKEFYILSLSLPFKL